jgi:hypothetical protein
MGSKKFDVTPDLVACQAMAKEFEAYLKSDVLHWQMDTKRLGGSQLPKLTIGGFLERARRLRAAPLSPDQQAALEEAIRQVERVRDAHRLRYMTKALHDLRSRLDAWAWFLDDYTKRPNEEAPYYPAQVHTRLGIELLLEELPGNSEVNDLSRRLSTLDDRLRAYWIDGAFVWHSSLVGAFPREQFWWLYGRLRQPE